MRILHILEDHNGRAANYASEVICGLQQTGIEQCAVVDRQAPYLVELEKAGIRILPLASHAWRPTRRLGLRGLIDAWRPDVAHCWNRNAAKFLPTRKIPAIGWLAGYDDPRRFAPCTHFVSDSRDAAAQLRDETKARYIPPVCRLSSAPPFDRMDLATTREAKVLLSLAPLHPASRFEILLGALRHVPQGVVWLAGEGPLRRVLEKKAESLGVLDRVRFVPARADRGALLRAADLCVLAAPDRPCGTIIPEAWAAGTAVVASRDAGFAAPLADNVTGLLAPSGDEEAFLAALRRALDDDGLRRRLIAKGYAAYLGTHAREAVIRQWMEFYREVAAA